MLIKWAKFGSYDEYFTRFESEPEDDDDPVIKQLKHNAYFDDEKEPGWVIVLPKFKRYRYNIKPVDRPVIKKKVRDPGLQHHNAIVNLMRDMTLKLAEKDSHSNEKIRTPPTNRVPKQGPAAPEIYRYNEPFIYEGTYKRDKKNNGSKNNDTMMSKHNDTPKV